MFVGYTNEEISIVCQSDFIPHHSAEREDGWTCIRICGKLDFSEIGIIARISAILASRKIEIFVVSTHHTDYFLIKTENFAQAPEALVQDEYRFSE